MSAKAPAVSRNCAAGNHTRCLGTVYVPKRGLVACECGDPGCGHGSDTAKARRKRDETP